MTLAHPQLLWLLAIPAALLPAAALARSRASDNPHPKIPRATFSPVGLRLRDAIVRLPRPAFVLLGLALLIAALARPQGAVISTPGTTQARDVLVAVDVSRSMLADDVAPTRLGRAQLLVRNLADELKGERLGLLPFAGTAFLQSPLSADYEIFRTFLDELGPDMIPAGGSNFAALLRTADEAFGPADSTAPDAPVRPDRYLVVLSDGEAEDDSWRPLAQKLSERGVRVLALGLGTSAGAMVPDGKGGLTKDSRGAAVLSRLNPATLQDLARSTDGAYRDASAWVDLPALLKETVARGRASRVATDSAPRRQELFAWFLAPALACLLLALVREFPASPRLSPRLPSKSATLARLVPFALALLGALALTPRAAAAAQTPPSPPPDPLVELVGKLASAPELAAPDLARLATLTADRGEQSKQPAPGASSPGASASVPEGAIRDALAAVSAGEAEDARAADWANLRKRLEALLAPPPQPSQKDQKNQKPDDQKSKPDKQDDKTQDKSSGGSPEKTPKPDESDSKSDNSQSDSSNSGKPDANQQNSPSGSSGKSGGSDQASSPDSAKPDQPKPDGSKPLGDLSKPADKPDAEKNASKPAPTDQSPPNNDEPPQQAGGVSASGRPSDASPTSDTASLDPNLVVPQQRLERVRNSDAPARLFQLLQDSENPPEARERRAAGTKQTW